MDIHKYFDEQVITVSKLPKERQRYTYYDLIAFAKVYAKEVNKNCNLHIVSQRSELLDALKRIEDLCDNQNETHASIWHVAYNAVKSANCG